jgi:hypothetical protein
LLTADLKKWNIRMMEHELGSVETKVVGFLARKLPKVTHLRRFTAFLKQQLPMTTPQFVLQVMYPKMTTGFDSSMKTEVVGVRTTKEDATAVDAAFARLFPADTTGEFYVSFLQETEEDILRVVYGRQNQWLQTVQKVSVGDFGNIDVAYDIGLTKPYSFREFMRDQPNSDKRVPLDVDNGGDGGRTQVIFLPEYQQQAKQLYQEFRTLTKRLDTPPSMEVDDDNTTHHSNSSSYRERMHEIFGQEAADSFPALPTSPTPPSLAASVASQTSGSKSKRPKKESRAPNSTTTSVASSKE